MLMRKEEFFFDSRDRESRIHAVKWIPDESPSCIVQIVHGMSEYVERYEEFAKYLTAKNILVVGEDHLGHGQSIGNHPPGYFCKKDAATVVVRDVHRLKKMVQEEYPQIPYIIFGHSMGSMMVRNYLTKYGTGIDGAVICATTMPNRLKLCVSGFLTRVLALLQGEEHESHFLDYLGFGNCGRRIKNPVSTFDWLSTDSEIVKKYNEDPLCGFCFTVNGFRTLKELGTRLYDKKALLAIPKELPVLFLYGTEDPIGAYGTEVEKTYRSYLALGMKHVKIKKYEGDRHELLNEKDRDIVMADVYSWICEHILDKRG